MSRLERVRRRKLLTQEELAELSGVSVATIHRLEAEKSGGRFSSYKKLGRALGIEPEKLVEKPKG